MATWTRPYFGVQHLSGLPKGWQITVEEYSEGFAQAYVLGPTRGFTPIRASRTSPARTRRARGVRHKRSNWG